MTATQALTRRGRQILAHLRTYNPDSLLKDDARKAYTQYGIIKALGTGRGTTSDLIRMFIAEDLVMVSRTVVGDRGGSVRTYALTDKGRAAVKLIGMLEGP
ncbi:MAG: hypothetical protein LLG45_13145 [Actinomycetia bacterium]|nr:hypothetical protein [Actinomycetes bacterium]